MMKFRIFPVLAAVLLMGLTACGEKDLLTDEEKNPESRNVKVWLYTYFNSNILSTDSIYTLSDCQIKIDDIKFTISGYKFSMLEDTVDVETSSTVASVTKLKHFIGELPPGTYNGEHLLNFGVNYDSSGFSNLAGLPEDPDMFGTPFGYCNMIIKGKFLPDGDTINTSPVVPFTYRLAGPDFVRHFEVPMTFSFTGKEEVTLFFNLDVDQLFTNGISPAVIPIINSTPTDNDDYDAAEALFTNLTTALYYDN